MREIIFIILLPFTLSAQIFEPFPNGLTLELGANYPSLSWKINESNQGNEDRKELWVKPNLQAGYRINIFHNFFVKLFVGYISFGGRSKEVQYGYKDKIVINALEVGTSLLYRINNLELGIGAKWNKHLNITQYHYGYSGFNSSPRQWEEEDMSFFFKKSSFDWGVRISYLLIYKLNIFTEYWTSIQDIESDNLSQYINIRNRTIKFGVGYNF